jgi:hypothetical protein
MENWGAVRSWSDSPSSYQQGERKYLRAKHQGKTDSFVELGKIFLE